MSDIFIKYPELPIPRVPLSGGRIQREDQAEHIIERMKMPDEAVSEFDIVWAGRLVGLLNDQNERLSVAANTLIAVGDSNGTSNDNEIVKNVHSRTGLDEVDIDPIFNWLFRNRYIQTTGQRKIVFGSNGYWLFEDLRNEDVSRPKALVARNLEERGFFPKGFSISSIVEPIPIAETSKKPKVKKKSLSEEDRKELRDIFYGSVLRRTANGEHFPDKVTKAAREWLDTQPQLP